MHRRDFLQVLAVGEPVWAVVSRHLRGKKTIAPRPVNQPRLLGVKDNPGMAQSPR